eukprot:scaffold18886_cov108-Cylindrotheca_fusiformis.AAC.3
MGALGNDTSSEGKTDDEDCHVSRDNVEQDNKNQPQDEKGSDRGNLKKNGISDSEDEARDSIVVNPPSSPTESGKPNGTISEKASHALGNQIPSFVKVGLERKASPLAIKSWASLALTLDGRDKITKVLQYVSRFLGWWFAGGRFNNQSLRFNALYKTLANSRKAYRLGRSFIELEKLRASPGIILWHLKNREEHSAGDDKNSRFLLRRASSNIGWGPSNADEKQHRRQSLARSLSGLVQRTVYRPMVSRMASIFAPDETPSTELWKICGTSIKLTGLLLFWAGDNCNFLFSTGFFDDYSLPSKERTERRKRWMSFAGKRAGQAYFVAALAGLLVNWFTYSQFHRKYIASTESDGGEERPRGEAEEQEVSMLREKKLKEKQFSLFLSLLKSCCDVTVFSNQPGIDLHKKLRGKKNHEGFHCLCGLISAGTVIYNNFPDSK